MGGSEVAQFLSSLAVEGRVAASTQNQALSALLFLYRYVLHQELPWLDDVVRARRPKHLPIVLTRDEVRAVISKLDGTPRFMAGLPFRPRPAPPRAPPPAGAGTPSPSKRTP